MVAGRFEFRANFETANRSTRNFARIVHRDGKSIVGKYTVKRTREYYLGALRKIGIFNTNDLEKKKVNRAVTIKMRLCTLDVNNAIRASRMYSNLVKTQQNIPSFDNFAYRN